MSSSYYFIELLDHYFTCFDKLKASECMYVKNSRQKINDRNLLDIKSDFLSWFDNGNQLADLDTEENKAVLKEKVLLFMTGTLGIDTWACEILDQESYYEVSQQFILRAKEMLGTSCFAEIFQALRNIWVMIALQIYMDLEVKLTDAMFAYSMLYPLTDNYLDNPSISIKDKQSFNERFHDKISMNIDHPINDDEKRIFSMIDLIESDFSRKDFKEVYDSLLAILDGQQKSLMQHNSSSLSEAELMKYTFYKGGTSVLADAYLVNGNLTEEQSLFAYGYGIILQMADDLQDIAEDISNLHDTPYNTTSRKMKLDTLFHKHEALISHLMENVFKKETRKNTALFQLLDKSITLLLFGGVCQNKKLFSRKFIAGYTGSSLFSCKAFNKLNKKIMRKIVL